MATGWGRKLEWSMRPSWTSQTGSLAKVTPIVVGKDDKEEISETHDPNRPIRKTLRLPLELIEHIINHLFDDKITLASCALVARSWVEPAHYHLFSSICHDLHVYPERTHDLGTFLISTPHRAKYVRELDLRKVVDDALYIEYFECHVPAIDSGFMATLLSSLPNLTVLNMLTIPFSGEERAFENLPPMMKMRSFSMSHVCSLPLVAIAHILRAFPLLQYLSLDHIGSDPDDEMTNETIQRHLSEAPSLQLEDIQLLGYNEDVWQLVRLCCSHHRTLRTVECDFWDQEEFEIIRSLIKTHHSYLTQISLNLTRININMEEWDILDLSDCDALEALFLEVSLIDKPDRIIWSWISTLDILSNVPPSLPWFGLWMKSTSLYAPRPEFPEICWEQFDQALEGLSELEGFEVRYLEKQWFEEFPEVIESYLPLTSKRGLLRFSPL